MFRLMPKQQKLFERLERIAAFGVESSALLSELLRAPDKSKELLPKLEAVEQQSDDANHEALAMLQKSAALPIAREELLALLDELDDIVDGCDATAHRLLLYRVQIIKPEAQQLARLLHDACRELEKAVRALRTGKENADVLQPVVEVNRLENEGDALMRKAIGGLFEHEKDAIELIKWKELFEVIEDTLDSCEHAANRVEAILLKNG